MFIKADLALTFCTKTTVFNYNRFNLFSSFPSLLLFLLQPLLLGSPADILLAPSIMSLMATLEYTPPEYHRPIKGYREDISVAGPDISVLYTRYIWMWRNACKNPSQGSWSCAGFWWMDHWATSKATGPPLGPLGHLLGHCTGPLWVVLHEIYTNSIGNSYTFPPLQFKPKQWKKLSFCPPICLTICPSDVCPSVSMSVCGSSLWLSLWLSMFPIFLL